MVANQRHARAFIEEEQWACTKTLKASEVFPGACQSPCQ